MGKPGVGSTHLENIQTAFFLFFLCMGVLSASMSVCVCSTRGAQKKAVTALELEFRITVSCNSDFSLFAVVCPRKGLI